jgi:hypothetical protein
MDAGSTLSTRARSHLGVPKAPHFAPPASLPLLSWLSFVVKVKSATASDRYESCKWGADAVDTAQMA